VEEAMAGKTQKPKKPPLEDPRHVRERFGDELILAAITDGGYVHLTFAAQRILDPTHEGGMPTVKREVTCRLILTGEAVNAMMNRLIQLSQVKALAKVQPLGPSDKAN
jgi:hypothetical protein